MHVTRNLTSGLRLIAGLNAWQALLRLEIATTTILTRRFTSCRVLLLESSITYSFLSSFARLSVTLSCAAFFLFTSHGQLLFFLMFLNFLILIYCGVSSWHFLSSFFITSDVSCCHITLWLHRFHRKFQWGIWWFLSVSQSQTRNISTRILRRRYNFFIVVTEAF